MLLGGLLFLSSLYCYSSEITTEDETTTNLLDSYEDSNINIPGNSYGMVGSDFTTGNQNQGGGRRIYDIDLSDYTNKQSIEYGSNVYSHISNSRVASCANTTSDCRDDFSITVRLYEGEVLQETYSHVYEGITWTGNRQFEFSQNVTDISFNTAELELYGIDRGYPSGYYGPGFADPYFKLTYQVIEIVTSILDTVEFEMSNQTEVYDEVIDTFEIEFETFDEEIFTFEIEVMEPTEDSFEIEFTTFEDDMEIEVEVIEISMEEMVEELDVEIEMEPDSEDAQESFVEAEEEGEPEAIQPSQAKEQIAKKIMDRVADTGDQVAINNVKLAVMAQLADTQAFDSYQVKSITDANIDNYLLQTIEDPYGMLFEIAQNSMMEEMINAQY